MVTYITRITFLLITCNYYLTRCYSESQQNHEHKLLPFHKALYDLRHRSRNDIAHILEKKRFQVGVELGVQKGLFALNNLGIWTSCTKYILVDIWAHVQESVYKDPANVGDAEQAKILESCKYSLQKYDNKVVYLQNTTVNAAVFVEDLSVDFIYVDARHDYCGCKEDIEFWWPKLRMGGLMAGHDYLDGKEQQKYSRGKDDDWRYCADGSFHEGCVKGAVNEFAQKHNLSVYTTSPNVEGPSISWLYSPKKHA